MSDSETRFVIGDQEIPQDILHPTGSCTCHGEGKCEWCKTRCISCGATEDDQIHQVSSCGRPFGREILLPGMKERIGLRAFCEKFRNHDGECGRSEFGPHPFVSMSTDYL